MQSSLHYLWEYLLQPLFAAAHVRTIVEIGAEHGECTRDLLHYCKIYGGTVHSMDTQEHPGITDLRKEFPDILDFHKGYSLNILPTLQPYDAVIIDGDHNWYTVYNELLLIQRDAQNKEFPLVVLHDVEWPYARRDLYHDPEVIPEYFRHPWKIGGMKPGQVELVESSAFQCNAKHSLYEGTMRNGVLTAVEDFLKENSHITYTNIPGFFGIGILTDQRTLARHVTLQSLLEEWNIPSSVKNHIHCIERARIDALVMQTCIRQEYEKQEYAHRALLKEHLKDATIKYAELKENNEHLSRKNEQQEQQLQEMKQRYDEQLQKLTAANAHYEQTLTRMSQTKSWRWTLWIRLLQKRIRVLLSPQPHTPSTEKESPFTPQLPEQVLPYFPQIAHPTVSIIIPVHNHWKFTFQCLQSIQQCRTHLSYEVIIVDDASTDDTAKNLECIANVTTIKQEKNQGFVAACNRGAAAARGRYLVFLNNDCIVQEGWLDALIGTFHTHPKAGLVGAKLLNADGTLQEAGGAVFTDGNATNIGRGKDPDDPAFSYLREVDYCSGACLSVRKELFMTLGGFDARYAPGYYEDTDLAFQARSVGWKVLYQPLAQVIHYEGISAGRDMQSGMKQFQEVNRKTFMRKWQKELQSPPSTRKAPRILVLDIVTPKYDQDSGSYRMVQLLTQLKTIGMHVTFMAYDYAHNPEYARHLQQLEIDVLHAPYITSLQQHLYEHGKRYDAVWLSRIPVARTHFTTVRRFAPDAKIVFDTVDLHFLRTERGAALTQSTKQHKEAQKLRTDELWLTEHADAVTVVSTSEKDVLQSACPHASFFRISNIHPFHKRHALSPERKDYLFIGDFLHEPNRDAVTHFIESIFPHVKELLPDQKFIVIGKDPPDILRKYEKDGVQLLGHVPTIDDIFHKVTLSIAPLRFGAGVKGKITMSMQYGVPVVTTSIGAEGIPGEHGKDFFVADDPKAFAEAMQTLFRDPLLWKEMSQRSQQIIMKNFSEYAARRELMRMMQHLGLQHLASLRGTPVPTSHQAQGNSPHPTHSTH